MSVAAPEAPAGAFQRSEPAGVEARGATFANAFRFALRELRGGLSGFYIFMACIALGVAAISGVNAVALSITQGIQQEGRTILGGDLALGTVQRELTETEAAFARSLGATSSAASTRAMARLPDGSDQAVVELKAVDGAWPLVGALAVQPPGAAEALSAEDAALVDPILLERLQLAVGDEIAIGAARYRIAGTITDEPDRVSDGFLFGPRVLMGRDGLVRSGLVQPGALIEYTTRIRMADPSAAAIAAAAERAREDFPEAGWRVRSSANAAPALARNVERFSQFLTLVGLTALIVGGVGVANAVRAFVDGKRGVIAAFKCLGAPGGFVFTVYLTQILLIAGVGIVAGLLLGGLLPIVARSVLADVLPVSDVSAFHPAALATATVYGVLTALAFALWPLARARDVPATVLLRSADRSDAPRPRLPYLVAMGLTVAALVAMAVLQAGDRRIALTFLAGVVFAFILLRIVADLIMRAARAVPQVRSTPLRLALGNIHRPGALTPSVVLSLGLGLALLVALSLIDGNLRRQISDNVPTNAPDFFFLDIQAAQWEPFQELVADVAPGSELTGSPMLRGRIVSINDVPAAEIEVKEGGEWVLRGDRGLTHSPVKPDNATLVEGEWWDADHTGENLVSWSAEEAGEVGVEIGDKIVVNVLGRNITATVANLREVEWESMRMNFVMVFSPNAFAGAPQPRLATLRVSDGSGTTIAQAATAQETRRDAAILRAITSNFPTITTVRVRDALATVNGLIGQLATAIRAAALIALVASILVLGGALAAGNAARIHDAVVLKTLGATRATLVRAFVTEYALLGLATALFALAAGGIAAWFVIAVIMGFSFTFLPVVALATVAGALVLTVGFGLVGTWRVLGQKAAPVLREL